MSTSGNYSLSGQRSASSWHLGSFNYASSPAAAPAWRLGSFNFAQSLPAVPASGLVLPEYLKHIDYESAFQPPHLPLRAMLTMEVAAAKFHPLHSVLTAARVAQAAQHLAHEVQAHGLTLPNVLCSTVGAATTLSVEIAGNAGMSAGIKAFAAIAIANPTALAATPGVAHMMVATHHMIERTGHIAGDAMGQYCQKALAVSQQLFRGSAQ